MNEAGKKHPVHHLDASQTKMMQWHGDTFDLPEDVILLASSGLYKNLIFARGANILALQCHPEVDHEVAAIGST